MTDLWHQFLHRLKQSGVELADIADCTAATLQSVLGELGFSALQTAKLQTEWNRRIATTGRITDTVSSGPAGASTSVASATRTTRLPIAEGSPNFIEVATIAADFFATAASASGKSVAILSVESVSNPHRERAFQDVRTRMCDPTVSSALKGRLVPLDYVDRTCSNGPVHHATVDRILPTGFVFLTEADDSSVGSILLGPEAVPTKLILFDVLLGNPKVLSDDDAAALSVYPAEEIQQSLRQEGFDSIRVQHAHAYRPDAFVIFDGKFAVARYIVTFAYGAARNSSPSRRIMLDTTDRSFSNADASFTSHRSPPGPSCPAHPGKSLDFWCTDERKLVCSHCMFLDGYQHKNVILAEQAAKEEAEWLRVWVDKAEVFSSDVGRVMSSFDAAMNHVDDMAEKAIHGLTQRVKDIKQQLDEAHIAAEEAIRTAARRETVALQRSLTEVVALQASVEDTARAARRAVGQSDTTQILSLRETAGRQWPTVAVPDYRAFQAVSSETVREAVPEFLRTVIAVEEIEGAVELPLVIDVNQLAAVIDTTD
jgi:hypothetical protein